MRKRGEVKVFGNLGFYTFRLIVNLDLDLDVHVESVGWCGGSMKRLEVPSILATLMEDHAKISSISNCLHLSILGLLGANGTSNRVSQWSFKTFTFEDHNCCTF